MRQTSNFRDCIHIHPFRDHSLSYQNPLLGLTFGFTLSETFGFAFGFTFGETFCLAFRPTFGFTSMMFW